MSPNWTNCPKYDECEDDKKDIMTYCEVGCSARVQRFEVRCNRCNWQGYKSQLEMLYSLSCPACYSNQYLEYREEQNLLLTKFQLSWIEILALRRDVLRAKLEQALGYKAE